MSFGASNCMKALAYLLLVALALGCSRSTTQRVAAFDLPRRNKLRNLQHLHPPRLLCRVDVTNRAVRRPQVNADDIAAGKFVEEKVGGHGERYSSLRTLNSSFHR